MRVLFHVEPLIMHARPHHHRSWLERAASMARGLAATGNGHETRFLLGQALAVEAVAPRADAGADPPARGQGLPAGAVVALRQDDVRRHFGAPNLAILDGFQHGRWPADRVMACGHALRERLGGFIPDVVVTWTPAPHLAAAYPGALVLHAGSGMLSRRPFPGTRFLDPLGLYARSVLGAHARELQARKPGAEERGWLETLRAEHRSWLAAGSPFHGLERALRGRHRRLALLPLELGGEPGFELNAPFRGPGEHLIHALERLPEGVGLIVAEHPAARSLGAGIGAETRAWVRERWPQAAWLERDRVPDGIEPLLLHVDDVIGLSSPLGLQALYWRKPLFTVGSSHLREWATAEGVERIDPARTNGGPDRDGAVAWMLRHYFVPDVLLDDGAWLESFLERSLARHAAGSHGLEFFDPVADPATLARLYAPPARRAPLAAAARRLARAAFAGTARLH